MSRTEQTQKLEQTRFYGIVDAGYVAAEEMLVAAAQLIQGGAGIIQLRAKGWQQPEILDKALELRRLCSVEGVLFVVNDFAEVAAEVAADGLHIGQDDGSLLAARKLVGEEMLIGRSTHSPQQAFDAVQEGFDYIGFGPLFPTPTKKGRPGIGLENIRAVTQRSTIPVFCIGGIKRDNIDEVVSHGAERVVVVSDVLLAEERAVAVGEVLKALDK